jgi:hypothetical protein
MLSQRADNDMYLSLGFFQSIRFARISDGCRLRNNGNSWHNVRAQPGAFGGTETAALPTLRAERRFIAAFQT